MGRSIGRSGRPWQRVVAAVKRIHPAVCWVCGDAIDMSLPPNHRMAHTVDHVVALVDGGAEHDLANLRPAHRSCNSRRGNRTLMPEPHASRDW